jgi:hypothetical protein
MIKIKDKVRRQAATISGGLEEARVTKLLSGIGPTDV